MDRVLIALDEREPVATRALRIVDFFDRIVDAGGDATTILRSVPMLTGCAVGMELASGARMSAGLRGEVQSGGQPAGALVRRLSSIDGIVWIDRSRGSSALDELILERWDLSLQRIHSLPPTVWSGAEQVQRSATDAEAVRRVVDSQPGTVFVVRVRVAESAEHRIPNWLRSTVWCTQSDIEITAVAAATEVDVLSQSLDQDDLVRAAGLSDAVHAGESARGWDQSTRAVRFAGGAFIIRERVVRYRDLGPLAHVDVSRARVDSLAEKFAEIAGTRQGRRDLEVYGAYLRAGSVRAAAPTLHLHPSSVAATVTRVKALAGSQGRSGLAQTRELVALLSLDQAISGL